MGASEMVLFFLLLFSWPGRAVARHLTKSLAYRFSVRVLLQRFCIFDVLLECGAVVSTTVTAVASTVVLGPKCGSKYRILQCGSG